MKDTENHSASKSPLPMVIQILLPIFLVILCAGILVLCFIRPYEVAKTYLHIAFMDSTGTSTISGTTTAGLNIIETDIDTNYTGETNNEGTVIIPDYGTQCAILEAESIGLYVPVYWGGGSELLEQGACITPASAAFGSTGNSVVSGHVNTFFHDLDQLEVGDIITAYTTYGKFTYEVTERVSFASSNKSYLKQTDDDRLTIYTCDMQLLGSSSTRVGTICTLTSKEFYETDTEITDNEEESTT